MRDRREDLGGAAVVVIGLGTPEQAETFCRRRAEGFGCVVAPDGSAHRAYGLPRGTTSQVAGPRVWGPWLRNLARGNPQTAFWGKGDVARLPGTFVVDAEGIVRYGHRGERSSDLAPMDEVVAAVTAARRPGSSA